MRKDNDICLLCKERKSTKKNSHIVPATHLKGTIGERDYEKSFQVNLNSGEVDKYYGRSVLAEDHPGITQHHHSIDYIFCPECESGLGTIEGEVGPIVNTEIFKSNYNQKFKVEKLNDLELVSFSNISQDVYTLYYSSIIWRINLKNKLEGRDSIISDEHEEQIRLALLEYIENTGRSHVSSLSNNYGFVVVSQRDSDAKVAQFTMSFPFKNYPNKHFINHNVLIFYNGENDPDKDPFSTLMNIEGVIPRTIVVPLKNIQEIVRNELDPFIKNILQNYMKHVFENTKLTKSQTERVCEECFNSKPANMDSLAKIENCKRELIEKYN